ncbi:MAG: hypothetical protein HY659_11730 [Rhizobiales bacterium]|nr:hypothetical protein [Hyphomicrobiales bacterium]
MRKLILGVLDFFCFLIVIVSTLIGARVASYTLGEIGLVVGGLVGFIVSALFAGGILALTEIAKNTRRMLEWMEREANLRERS